MDSSNHDKTLDNRQNSPQNVPRVSNYHRAAIVVALAAGVLTWIAYGFAMRRSPSVFGEQGAALFRNGQLSGVGGIIAGILIAPQIRDAKFLFALASGSLILGTISPWLYQIIPGASTDPLWTSAREFGPALFSFGVGLLSKAADANTGDPAR
ncbi:hypothetical protein [Sorangium sp. So ce388]|uniref:hypothetical protein n=1 Tax=Sorangium sp. So ce388 TaxID=3133309 RepID=UPI003F5C92C5